MSGRSSFKATATIDCDQTVAWMNRPLGHTVACGERYLELLTRQGRIQGPAQRIHRASTCMQPVTCDRFDQQPRDQVNPAAVDLCRSTKSPP